jgi:hypothetical protein
MTGSSENREIEQLVRQLDADSTGDAEEAQAELTHRGRETDVIAPVLRALPTLNSFGQLCAIEILQQLGDARAGQPLIDLLTSEHNTVRDWSALALAQLRVIDAIPALWRAYQACKDRGDPPDWTEPHSIRFALTELGARHPVVPSLTASLRITTSYGHQAWPSARLTSTIPSPGPGSSNKPTAEPRPMPPEPFWASTPSPRSSGSTKAISKKQRIAPPTRRHDRVRKLWDSATLVTAQPTPSSFRECARDGT